MGNANTGGTNPSPDPRNTNINNTQNIKDYSLLESVCHSLYNIKIFRNEIKDPKDSIVNKKMSILLRDIFKNIEKKDYSDYCKRIIQIFQEYGFFIPTEPHVLIYQIFYLIHLERKEQRPLGLAESQNNFPLNLYDENNALQYFYDNEVKNNNSLIVHIFRGVQQMKRQFNGNPRPMFSYQYFDIFEINIPPIFMYLMKNNKQFANTQFNPQISLYQCLEVCRTISKKVVNGNMCLEQLNIYSTPPCLIFAVKRSFGTCFYGGKFIYDEIIDLSSYTLFKETGNRYKLIGVIKQKGLNNNDLETRVRGIIPFSNQFFTLITEDNSTISYFENNQKKTYKDEIDRGFFPVVLFYSKISE